MTRECSEGLALSSGSRVFEGANAAEVERLRSRWLELEHESTHAFQIYSKRLFGSVLCWCRTEQ